MNWRDDILKSLAAVQETSKRLIADAIARNDFATVTRIAGIADNVDRIISDVADDGSRACSADTTRDEERVNDNGAETRNARSSTQAKKTGAPRRRKDDSYPTFLREGSDLVKIGKSRSSPDVYEHRAPHELVERVVKEISAVGGNGKRFSSNVVQERTANGGGSVPSYQVYAVIAWLKWSGLILQHGRQGYSIATPQRFRALARSAWEQLKTR